MQKCFLSTVATDVLVLKYQALSIHSADQITFALEQFQRKVFRLKGTTLEYRVTFWNIISSWIRVNWFENLTLLSQLYLHGKISQRMVSDCEIGTWLALSICVKLCFGAFNFTHIMITYLGLNYSGSSESVSWLLMPWLLVSPGYQYPWYWLWRRRCTVTSPCVSPGHQYPWYWLWSSRCTVTPLIGRTHT